MMNLGKVLLAGGSGGIGTYLSTFLESKGYAVSILTRNKKRADGEKYFYWNVEEKIIHEACLDQVDYLIQLSGASISDKRWTSKRKLEIVNSRVNATNFLFHTIDQHKVPLKAFISASGVGYYGSQTLEHIYTENDLPGNDFLANTCVQWEEATNQFKKIGIRTVAIRTGIVLMKKDGALPKLLIPTYFGFLTSMGNGKQYFPWIHIEDLCRIYHKAICDDNVDGKYNAVSPATTTNKLLMETLKSVLNKPLILLSIPSFVLKIVFGELSTTLLNGSRISAKKICNSGYVFQFDKLQEAIVDLIEEKK